MDHVIEGMEVHYEVTLDWFMEQRRLYKYKKLSNNPHYEEIRALIDAMNILRRYMGWETLKLSEEVKRREEK